MPTSSRTFEHHARSRWLPRGGARPVVLAAVVLAVAVVGVLAAVGWPHVREQMAFARLRSSDTRAQDEAAAQLVRYASGSVVARTIEIAREVRCGSSEDAESAEAVSELCSGILVGCGAMAAAPTFVAYLEDRDDGDDECADYFRETLISLVEADSDAVDVLLKAIQGASPEPAHSARDLLLRIDPETLGDRVVGIMALLFELRARDERAGIPPSPPSPLETDPSDPGEELPLIPEVVPVWGHPPRTMAVLDVLRRYTTHPCEPVRWHAISIIGYRFGDHAPAIHRELLRTEKHERVRRLIVSQLEAMEEPLREDDP